MRARALSLCGHRIENAQTYNKNIINMAMPESTALLSCRVVAREDADRGVREAAKEVLSRRLPLGHADLDLGTCWDLSQTCSSALRSRLG